MLSNTEGTWLLAAQAKDDRYLADWERLWEQAQQNPAKASRPQLAGFDALRSEIHGLRNDLRLVNRLPLLDGPESPLDRMKDRKKAIGDRRLDAALGFDN